jgi:dTDP-4-amino-4,6-dideoxygalactose transaminase
VRAATLGRLVRLAEPARDYTALQSALAAAVQGVLASGEYVQDTQVAALEQELADRCGVAHAVATASGTMALLIALRALGIGPGDEVITAPYTSVCTTAAITHSGAAIRFADVKPETLTLDPERAAVAVTPRTRALLPVHLHGLPAEMDTLRAVAERHGLAVVEDAALALGARYRGQPAGSLGHAAAVSFAPSKILGGVGWGGVLLTHDPEAARLARQLAGFGPAPETEGTAVDVEGYNAQMSALQAAALRVKLAHLDAWLARRRAIAARYAAACDRLGLARLHPPAHTSPAWRTFVVLAPDRDAALAHFRAAGVEAAPHFVPALHLRPLYRRLGYGRGDFPAAEAAVDRLLCLPVHPQLTEAEVNRVIAALEGLAG